MKRLLALLAFCSLSAGIHAQVTDATVCDVLKDPASFNGKIIRIKGIATAGFDRFTIKSESCHRLVNTIWLSYPEGAKAKSGPWALVQLQPAKNFPGAVQPTARTPVTLEKNKDFKQFDSLLSTPHKGPGMCLGCARYDVSATFVGRIDGVAEAGLRKDAAGKIVAVNGFGNLNAYAARLVLQSVSDVSPREVDFSKTNAVTKDDKEPDSDNSDNFNSVTNPAMSQLHSIAQYSTKIDALDAIPAAQKSASVFGPGSPVQMAIDRATGAFGKPREHNGVAMNFGIPNEASARDEAQANRESPDGVLFNCTYNMGHLQGDALIRAVVHMGQHIADLRTPPAQGPVYSLYEMEFQAWTTTVLSSLAGSQKTLTLPGAYLVWNSAWPANDRDKELNDSLSRFESEEELLGR